MFTEAFRNCDLDLRVELLEKHFVTNHGFSFCVEAKFCEEDAEEGRYKVKKGLVRRAQ